MPAHEILARYKKGERSFDNVMCTGAQFDGVTLAGISFRNADLSFSSFDTADLTGADFSEAFLDWSSFRRTVVRRTKFDGASMKWCALNEAIVDKTSFRKADMSWSIMFSTNRNNADWTDANFITCAFDPSEITAKGIALHPDQIEKLKSRIPYEIWLRIKFSLQTVAMRFERRAELDVSRSSYATSLVKAGYGAGAGMVVRQPKAGAYTPGAAYTITNPYQTERKKTGSYWG